MRIGGFWGITAPMLVLMFPEKEDAIPFFRVLSATASNDVLKDLQKELAVLSRVKALAQYSPSVSVSKELGNSQCMAGTIDGDAALYRAFEREFLELSLVRVMEQAAKSVCYDLSGFGDKASAYLRGKSFPARQVRRFVKEFVGTLPRSGYSNYGDLLAKYPLRVGVVDSVVVNGVRRTFSADEKAVIKYYLSRCSDVEWWVDSLQPGSIGDESVFGVPFFHLIKRKPESLRYAVLNVFEYLKKNSSAKVLYSAIESVSADIAKFRELYGRYVSSLNSSDGEIMTPELVAEALEGQPESVKGLFQGAVAEGVLQPSNYLVKDFKMLVQLGGRVCSMTSQRMDEVFGVHVGDWESFGESLSEVGICGINSCSDLLFMESLQGIVMSVNKIYRSADVIAKVEFIVGNELEALISTMVPVGEVIV